MTDDLIKRLRHTDTPIARPGELDELTDEAADALEAAADLIEQQAARIAELEAQTATVAPAVDAQPVAWMVLAANTRKPCEVTLHKSETEALRKDCVIPLYASAQSEGLRKDAERLDWLDKNMFHREKNEWDARIHRGETMWVMFGPNGVQGSARNVIDAALSQHKAGDRNES